VPDAFELALVMPVYNEAAAVGAVLDEWTAALDALGVSYRLLVLDDGSTDDTPQRLAVAAARLPRVEVIRKPNTGHGQTCIAGYRAAIERGAAWVFQVDSDGQCDPQYFPAVWALRERHPAVFGYRRSRDDGAARTLISQVTRAVTSAASGVPVRDPNVPYRLVRADVLSAAIVGFPGDFHLANILLTVILTAGLGRRMGYVPIGFRDRHGRPATVRLFGFAREGKRLAQALWRTRGYARERAAAVRAVAEERAAHPVA